MKSIRQLPLWAIALGVFLVVLARCFVFGDFAGNEVDVLPSARQSADESWLPNDWYLNLDIGYRSAFNAAFGPVVSALGFRSSAVVGRCVAYLLLAFAVAWLFRTLSILPGVGLLVLTIFLNNQSLFAGEWMVLGIETKAIAYPMVLLSLVCATRNRWRISSAFLGVALSFHILVGFYAAVAWGAAFLFLVIRRRGWSHAARSIWPFFITGAWGLVAIARQLLRPDTTNGEGWKTYVSMRVPHHVTPDLWSDWYWLIILALFVWLCVHYLRRPGSNGLRTIALFGLATLVPLVLGFVVWGFGPANWMRFYWFRFPDVMVPFLTVVLVAAGTSQWIRTRSFRWVDLGLAAVLVVASVVQAANRGAKLFSDSGWGETEYADVLEWIKENGEPHAVFLVDPSWQEFYVRAERAMFVSFKHSPQSPDDLVEWKKRMVLCNGGRPFTQSGFAAKDEASSSFSRLDSAAIARITRNYTIDYIVVADNRERDYLPIVHRGRGWNVYAIPD